jgi:deazaflavin-dependent oxidoreductase (nitroreductase family)
MRFQWGLHRLVWRLTGGRLGRRVVGMPVIELVTTGYRSGQPRRILITYVVTRDGPVLAGTNAGADRDPAWIQNLRADPAARMRQAGTWKHVRARFLEGEDYDRVWRQFVEASDSYAGYRRMLDRHIPLVVLEESPRG